jgi:hypothetical protein
MASNIKLSKKLILQATTTAKSTNRSIADQIEHWVKIGKLVEENPDLTYDFIKQLLISKKESTKRNLLLYTFDSE